MAIEWVDDNGQDGLRRVHPIYNKRNRYAMVFGGQLATAVADYGGYANQSPFTIVALIIYFGHK